MKDFLWHFEMQQQKRFDWNSRFTVECSFFPINSVIAGCNKIPCDFRSIQYGFPPDFLREISCINSVIKAQKQWNYWSLIAFDIVECTCWWCSVLFSTANCRYRESGNFEGMHLILDPSTRGQMWHKLTQNKILKLDDSPFFGMSDFRRRTAWSSQAQACILR